MSVTTRLFDEARNLDIPGVGRITVLNKRFSGVPDWASYIGRGSRWGNPFRIGPDGNRDEVIEKYAAWFETTELERHLDEIRGRSLVCWCAPQRCHGHFLLARANRSYPRL
nr:DUF4326 domain-containing protein [Neorhizobium tomejilense]